MKTSQKVRQITFSYKCLEFKKTIILASCMYRRDSLLFFLKEIGFYESICKLFPNLRDSKKNRSNESIFTCSSPMFLFFWWWVYFYYGTEVLVTLPVENRCVEPHPQTNHHSQKQHSSTQLTIINLLA